MPDFTPLPVSPDRPRVDAARAPAGYMPEIAQMQKHWVQAMLNEDACTPFPCFYEYVTAWSPPLPVQVS